MAIFLAAQQQRRRLKHNGGGAGTSPPVVVIMAPCDTYERQPTFDSQRLADIILGFSRASLGKTFPPP